MQIYKYRCPEYQNIYPTKTLLNIMMQNLSINLKNDQNSVGNGHTQVKSMSFPIVFVWGVHFSLHWIQNNSFAA